MVEALLTVHDIARYFDVSRSWLARAIEGQSRLILKAVDGVSFDIPRGQTLSLVGESGCGKSTVARVVVGLYRPTRGRIEFDGVDVTALKTRDEIAPVRSRFQMIFQDPYASLNPRWRVARIVAEPIRAPGLMSDRTAIRRRVDELLRLVGPAPWDGEKYPHEFSGGQRQRISIARALSETIPKPMVTIGYRPILWNVMKYYAYYGHKDFILCLGYRADVIKNYFLNYKESLSNDFVLSEGGTKIELLNSDIHDWRITFVYTGLNSTIGQRLKSVEKYLEGETEFLANYSDGLSDLPLDDEIEYFRRLNKIGCFAKQSADRELPSSDDRSRRCGPVHPTGDSVQGFG